MRPARSVVVTGIGVVSPLAVGSGEHFRRLTAGESGIGPAPETAPYREVCPLEGSVRGFDRRSLIADRMLRKLLTRSAGYAVVAAGEALGDAGLGDPEVRARAGLYGGSVCIDFDPAMFIPALRESLGDDGRLDIARFARRGIHLIDPLFLVKALPNGGIGGIAIEHGVTGPSLNITNGPVSGLQAVILAVEAIRRGEADVVVAGGYDSLLNMDSIAEHVVAGRVSRGAGPGGAAVRPFAEDRGGYVLGEGSAFLVLESGEHARARGARPRAEILGTGFSTVAADGAGPLNGGAGLGRAARRAIDEAGAGPDDVDVAFVDGLATDEDDLHEARTVADVFGGRSLPVTSATGLTGFTGAASGALSLVHAVQSLEAGVVPAVGGPGRPDPRLGAWGGRVPEAPLRLPLARALAWNSAGGVKNAAVLVGAPSP